MGIVGGCIGALYNYIHGRLTAYRSKHVTSVKLKVLTTFAFCSVSFLLPVLWNDCTPLPIETASWTSYETNLLGKLVRFECPENYYNQVASLYFTSADTTLQQLVS